MRSDVDPGFWALVAVAAFLLFFGLVVWLGVSQRRKLHRWLDEKVSTEGWTVMEDHSAVAAQGWAWLESLRASRGVGIDRLAVDPVPDGTEAAFTLFTRRYGERAGFRRTVGVGLIARLPRPIPAPIIAVPWTAGVPFYRWFLGLELPAVEVSHQALAHTWHLFSPDPHDAARTVEVDADLRAALMAIAQEGLGYPSVEEHARRRRVVIGRPERFHYLVLEFRASRIALLGGPVKVGRQPFEDLQELAALASCLGR